MSSLRCYTITLYFEYASLTHIPFLTDMPDIISKLYITNYEIFQIKNGLKNKENG